MKIIKIFLLSFTNLVYAIDSNLVANTLTNSYINTVYPEISPITLVANKAIVSIIDVFSPKKSPLDEAEDEIYKAFKIEQ